MRSPISCLVLLLITGACATPLTVRREWTDPDRDRADNVTEFEDYRLTDRPGGYHVWLEHRETFMPWDLVRHYLGEKLSFEFPTPEEGGGPVPVSKGYYELRAYAPVETTFREGEVVPIPGDPESIGDFRLIFDGIDAFDRNCVLSFTGRLRRDR